MLVNLGSRVAKGKGQGMGGYWGQGVDSQDSKFKAIVKSIMLVKITHRIMLIQE